MTTSVAIIGAGPAGLTAAYTLKKKGGAAVSVTVLEADPRYVGGISRTAEYKGFLFDIGGHRFFSKSQAIEELWTELLPNDMLERPRSSRIFYNGQFYTYPLRGLEALRKLGPVEAARCLISYAHARLRPVQKPQSFEEWVSNQFGHRLFNIFFKTYTEKVWGMSCKEISADWAAQRIQGLSLSQAIWNALKPQSKRGARGAVIKTLIDSFRYPRKGPGMLWDAAASKVRALGGEIRMGAKVTGLRYEGGAWSVRYRDAAGVESIVRADHVVSSAPMRDIVTNLEPTPSALARTAAASLRYRDFVTVMLILRDKHLFDDNWIYIHDPSVKVGRIQNFKSWSPEMVPDPSYCCYGLEYFCFEGDGLWQSSDADLCALAAKELAQIGLAEARDVVDGCVVRQPKAYPVYDDGYTGHVGVIRDEVARDYPGLHFVGRNGMHKYNNQDHAMMTALLCAENILAGKNVYDLWQVNQDAEYHEAGARGGERDAGGRAVPKRARVA
jgi:protoporphyrinogen oxidase